jgi:hypothetical protein
MVPAEEVAIVFVRLHQMRFYFFLSSSIHMIGISPLVELPRPAAQNQCGLVGSFTSAEVRVASPPVY